MKSFGIRTRVLFVVLAPAVLVAILVTVLLVAGQVRLAETEQHRRLAAVARQLAALAEYNLFVGNADALYKLVEAARREPDVIAAAFLDTRGKILASSVPPRELPPAGEAIEGFETAGQELTLEHWHVLPIRATQLSGGDVYASASDIEPPPLGNLLLKISTQTLHDEMHAYAIRAALIAAVILFFGVLLAMRLSRGVIHTLTDIGGVVEGIGRGKLDLRVAPAGKDELGKLAEGINAMAAAVEHAQDRLTERIIEATATLRFERDEAAHAAQARSRFFAAASHDLRQPAQALGLFVARLQRDTHQPELREKLQQLAHTVDNLQNLLATLLDYSRLDGQVFRVEICPVLASQAISRVVDSFAAAAGEKSLRLRIRVQDCWLLTDPALLHRILINLIGNAVRYTPHGGILVTCRRGERHARIEVWDTGPGIPPESRAAIFEELVQLDNPERDAEKGLGLGLAIVRKSAELLGHPLHLCSRVGQGSRFSLNIPLGEALETEDVIEETPQPHQSPVLLIGPATADQDDIARWLEGWQFPVDRVPDLPAATARLTHAPYPRGAIIELPEGAAGMALALDWLDHRLTEPGPRLPTLLIGGGPATALNARVEQAGESSRLILTRPFRPARLRALVNRLFAPADGLAD